MCVCVLQRGAECLPCCNYNMHNDLILLCQSLECTALDVKLQRKMVCNYFQYADYILCVFLDMAVKADQNLI